MRDAIFSLCLRERVYLFWEKGKAHIYNYTDIEETNQRHWMPQREH